jgi:thioredoxin-like negative regulator of GroEL
MLLILIFAKSDYDFSTSVVTSITTNDFNLFIPSQLCSIIEFYSPLCSHCKEFAPIYDEVYNSVSQLGTNILIAKIDGNANFNIISKYPIYYYPTIVAFLPGNSTAFHEVYTGVKEKDPIINWIFKVCPK